MVNFKQFFRIFEEFEARMIRNKEGGDKEKTGNEENMSPKKIGPVGLN